MMNIVCFKAFLPILPPRNFDHDWRAGLESIESGVTQCCKDGLHQIIADAVKKFTTRDSTSCTWENGARSFG